MAAFAGPAMILGTAAQAVGGIMASREKSAAAQFEGEQYRIQRQQLLTAAQQDEASRRGNLNASIDTIMAIRAGRGVGQASPTATAIIDDIIGAAERDININRANILARADQSRMSAEFADRRKRMALTAGDIGAVSTLASAGFRYGRLQPGTSGLYDIGV